MPYFPVISNATLMTTVTGKFPAITVVQQNTVASAQQLCMWQVALTGLNRMLSGCTNATAT